MFKNLLFEENNSLGVLKFNRPQAMNALNHETITEFNQFLEELEKNKTIRCLVITGSGDKAFIAGADIKEFKGLDHAQARLFAQNGQRTLSRLEALPIPVIAAVNGFALGGGLEVALACDMIWASDKAKFGLPEVSLGIMPGYGGTQRLTRWVGLGRAREMTFSGQFYDAKTAYEFGLVQRVLSPETLLAEVMKLAETISSRGPVALQRAKKTINEGTEKPLAEGLKMEANEFSFLFNSEDHLEGITAFIEKRPAKFLGK